MNREWHREHTMPSGATAKERITWHQEHAKNCACRPFPKGLLGKLSDEQKAGMREQGPGIATRDKGTGKRA